MNETIVDIVSGSGSVLDMKRADLFRFLFVGCSMKDSARQGYLLLCPRDWRFLDLDHIGSAQKSNSGSSIVVTGCCGG